MTRIPYEPQEAETLSDKFSGWSKRFGVRSGLSALIPVDSLEYNKFRADPNFGFG